MTSGERVDQINTVCEKWIDGVENLIVFGLQGEDLSLRMRLLGRAKSVIRNAQKKCIAEAVFHE